MLSGHWLNHGKEHCLVGVKGNPKNFNRGLDCDLLVSEVRDTSHKPDEIYGMIERFVSISRIFLYISYLFLKSIYYLFLIYISYLYLIYFLS